MQNQWWIRMNNFLTKGGISMDMQIVLASSSPRRQDLLRQVGVHFKVRVADVDEKQITVKNPVEKVRQLALLKGRNVSIEHDNEIIIAADTVVSFEKQVFEKPETKKEAYDMIHALSGTTHEVYTGVSMRSVEQEKTFVEKTIVEFWPLKDEDIKRYVQTDEPYDKAGAYGIQSYGAIFVKGITGDYYNVVGLPISRVVRELNAFQ